MPEMKTRSGSSLRDLALFLTAFGIIWAGCVVFVWKFDGLPVEARPWFRTALWCFNAGVWLWWQRPLQPLGWLGLTPFSRRVAAVSAIAFVVVFGWNLLRVQLTGAAANGLGSLPAGGYAWGFAGVFVEELIFRGVVQTRLSERLSTPVAIVVSAALFLAIHVPGWIILALPTDAAVVASVFLLGLICGWIRWRVGSLWPAVAAHWANNLGAML